MEYTFWTERKDHKLTLETRAVSYFDGTERLITLPATLWRRAEEMLDKGWWYDFEDELRCCRELAIEQSDRLEMPLDLSFDASLEYHIADEFKIYKGFFEKFGLERFEYIPIPGKKPIRVSHYKPSNVLKFKID